MLSIQDISANGEWEVPREDFSISSEIGKGSFGNVFHASWRGTPIAAKVLCNSPDSSHKSNICELRTELDLLSRLHHPNIVQLLGAFTALHPYTILMEYLPYTLENIILENSIDNSTKLSIAVDIARGLAYIHHRKPDFICHRDLKPSNILLTVSYKAKLADFGISMIQHDPSITYNMTGETGSYRYMAPEVLNHKEYNHKVDIWSFGMVLYFMFITIPFIEFSFNEMLCMISVYNTPNLPVTSNVLISNIIKLCWKKPVERPDSLNILDLLSQISFPKPLPFPKSSKLFSCFS